MSHLAFALSFLCIVTFTDGQIMTGGIMEQNPNDPEHMVTAWKAVDHVNDFSSNGQNLMVPIKVMKAASQVVAGTKYILEVLYGESICAKGIEFAATPANCPVKRNGRRAMYEVELWTKEWENFERLSVRKILDIPAGQNIMDFPARRNIMDFLARQNIMSIPGRKNIMGIPGRQDIILLGD
ncbi:cystatin domain protein [Necator americanus]|uniref:Cystatin domain protein n=1 Tax=Necator americanus TaxID=51031 RepID=W2TG96_NECAM|nr:cystatin domain protein [Necator americanus]ETN80211.1 cystatin domain protein [Necator americanus]